MLRLIVVGINSFHSGRGVKKSSNTGEPTYDGEGGGEYNITTANDGTPHVVFQFQNVATLRRVAPTMRNPGGGYPATEVRQYLTPVAGYPDSGKFLKRLTEAGVPNGVLWGPVRAASTDNGNAQNI